MDKVLALSIVLTGGDTTESGIRVFTEQFDLNAPVEMPVEVTFQNVGELPIRVLKTFEPAPIFFSFDIIRDDGMPIDTPGAGKISIDTMEFLNLMRGESFSVSIDIAPLLPEPLAAGKYSLSVEYHNQYGDGHSFTGKAFSNTVPFAVLKPDEMRLLKPDD